MNDSGRQSLGGLKDLKASSGKRTLRLTNSPTAGRSRPWRPVSPGVRGSRPTDELHDELHESNREIPKF